MRFLLALMLMVSPAAAQEIVVQDLCGFSPQYQQPAGVEFKAETDDVVAADINPLNTGVPSVIHIPITVQLAERFPSLGLPSDLELEPDVGSIAIHQDGRIEYNGQDISAQVKRTCGTPVPEENMPQAAVPEDDKPAVQESAPASPSPATDEKPVASPAEGNGQEASDPVESEPKLIQMREGIEGEVLDGQYP